MKEIDRIRELRLNPAQNDRQICRIQEEEYQFFESGDLLQGDMLTVQGGKSDWTSALTQEYNKLGLGPYTWTEMNGIADAAVKSQDNLIDLLRMYEGHGDNFEAKLQYVPDNTDYKVYGFGLTRIAMEAIGGKYNAKTKTMSNAPKNQQEAYEQMIKYLNDVVQKEVENIISKDIMEKAPTSVKAALFDYHVKNGATLMREESKLKTAITNAITENSAEKWSVVLKELVWAKPAIKPFKQQEDNPGIYRRSLSRIILAAKGIRNGMSENDAAIIDKTVKEVYEDAVKCSKANDNRGLAEIETIYQAYVQNISERTALEQAFENKYVVPSQMGLYSAANTIIPDNAAQKNGVDPTELRKAVINEIIRLNNIPTNGVDANGYPKVRLLEQGEELILPTSVKVNNKTITLQAPANWEGKNIQVQNEVDELSDSEPSDDEPDEDEESIRILDLLYQIDSTPVLKDIKTDKNLQCATFIYKVQKGDTIYRLALRYGVDWKTLLADNGMKVKDPLPIGKKLKINKVIYKVQKGDTLTKIAKKYGLTVDYIRDVNNLENADRLNVGQQLEFPGYVYTVKKGDNLTQISKKVGVDIADLGKLNGLKHPYTIQPGQQILVVFNDADYNVPDNNKVTSVNEEGNTVTKVISDNSMLSDRQYLYKNKVDGKCVANRHVFKPEKELLGKTINGKTIESIDDIEKLPLYNKTIIINAGHGYKPSGFLDKGALGLKGHNDEIFVNYDNSMLLIKKLLEKGAKVIYIQGYEGKSKYNMDLVSQELKKSRNNANLFISVHANSSNPAPAVDRAEIFYHRDSKSSHGKKLAEILEKKLDNYQGKAEYAQTKSCGYQVLKTVKNKNIPAVLWEIAFINNKTGSDRLGNTALMNKYTDLMTESIIEYFNNSSGTTSSSAVSSSSETAATQKAKSNYTIHTVKKGETLSKIANKYGVTVAQIKKLNGLKNDTITVGQKLKIKKN